MLTRKRSKQLAVALLSMTMVIGNYSTYQVFAAESFNSTLAFEEKEEADIEFKQAIELLGADFDEATGTLKLKSDVTLTSGVALKVTKPLTIDMNGKKVTGEYFHIYNDEKAPVVIAGKGAFKDCMIIKYGAGKLSLEGDIVYKNEKERALSLFEGITVIREGRFFGKKTSILWSDLDWECGDSYLYIKGGTFHGDIELSNNATYLYDGVIGGKIKMYTGRLFMKGGTIKKGIVSSYNDEKASEIYISGGTILNQILLDNPYGGMLKISGGSIKSGKSAVIQSNVLETEKDFYSKIIVKGGTLISTRENGYGIKAVNSEITVEGGTIQNTTKKGKTAIYNVRYTAKRKVAQIKDAKKVSIKGFGEKLKNIYKKN